jgi:ubiquinone/menaquinone biosynthesis C-methylase UbiE
MSASRQWQLASAAAKQYERVLVAAILGPFAQALVRWSELQAGEVVVDVGCGTGAAARFAAATVGSTGRVVGVDINTAMIGVAKSLPPVHGATIDWYENSAFDLPLADQSVDVALCAQTLQFLTDRKLALAEMVRVTKPDGRVALSLWCDIQGSPYFAALVTAISDHIGSDTAAGLGAAFGLTDPDEINSLVSRAGFNTVELTTTQLELDLPPLEEFVPQHIEATPMAVGYQAASQAVQQAVVAALKTKLAPFKHKEGLRVPFKSYLIRGYKQTHGGTK